MKLYLFGALMLTSAILLRVSTSRAAAADVERQFFKKTDCGDFCSRVRYLQQTQEECDEAREVFVPRDGDCYCCDRCEPKVADQKCTSNHCDTVKCRDVPSKECFDKGMAFAPKDECTCCDTCV